MIAHDDSAATRRLVDAPFDRQERRIREAEAFLGVGVLWLYTDAGRDVAVVAPKDADELVLGLGPPQQITVSARAVVTLRWRLPKALPEPLDVVIEADATRAGGFRLDLEE